jgi:hypothetical protein
MRSLMICTPHPVLLGDKIEKDEMGGAGNAYGERRGAYWVIGLETGGNKTTWDFQA